MALYIYPVPRRLADDFIRIQTDASRIYREHGALEDVTYAPASLEARYGCASFRDTLALGDDEDLYVGYARFRDRGHHDQVIARVDADPRISALYRQVSELIDVGRIVRGEFELPPGSEAAHRRPPPVESRG
jgi:uncharacterized protein YbaA (DUF1428 family)